MQGNKKGPLGRWDFDTQEEYSDYMNNKEALPKYVLRNIPLEKTVAFCFENKRGRGIFFDRVLSSPELKAKRSD